LYRKALKIVTNLFGKNHPKVVEYLTLLADVYRKRVRKTNKHE